MEQKKTELQVQRKQYEESTLTDVELVKKYKDYYKPRKGYTMIIPSRVPRITKSGLLLSTNMDVKDDNRSKEASIAYAKGLLVIAVGDKEEQDLVGKRVMLSKHAQTSSFSFNGFISNDEYHCMQIRTIDVSLTMEKIQEVNGERDIRL